MNIAELEIAAQVVLDRALEELDLIQKDRDSIESCRHFHRDALRQSKVDFDSAQQKLPGLLSRLWMARASGDKAEKSLEVELVKLRRVIADAVAHEQQAQATRDGLDAMDKSLNQRAHGSVESSPVARRNNSANVLQKIALYRSEGAKHGDSLRYLAQKIGLEFSLPEPTRTALAA
jgi:hypothetical protein